MHTTLFLGAGASVFADIPTMEGLRLILYEQLSRNNNPGVCILHDSFKQANIKDIEDVYACLESLDGVKEMDAYLLLENLKLYKEGKMHETIKTEKQSMFEIGNIPATTMEKTEEPVTVSFSDIMRAAAITIETIRDVLNENVVVDCTKDTIIKDTYDKILDILPDDTPILTTNYDNIIERYYEGVDPPIRQGFKREGFSYVWNNYWTGEGRILVKIHGSLLWKRDGDKIKAYDTKAERGRNEDVMIYPTQNLKEYKDVPFVELFSQANKILKKTNLLIVLGFSFRDDNINKIIRDCLDCGMKMVVFGKDAVEDIKEYFYIEGLNVGITIDNDIITHNLDLRCSDASDVMRSVVENVNQLMKK